MGLKPIASFHFVRPHNDQMLVSLAMSSHEIR